MRAAYLVEPGKIEVREVDRPSIGTGEILVKVECALTCGTDLKAYRRGHPFIPMPGRFGHQYTGTVAEVGKDVEDLEIGMPILGVHSGPCGECRACKSSHFNLCERLAEQLVIGAFAEYFRITPRVVQANVFPRPHKMSALRAAFLEPVSCVVHTLRIMDFRGVDRVLVLGLGSMGLLFLQALPFFTGASRVGAGRRAQRIALAKSYGLEEVADVEKRPVEDWIASSGGFDCVIECTGRPEGWQQAIDAVRPGGQVMLFGGLPKGTTFPIDTYKLHYEELKVLGSFHFAPEDVRAAADLLSDPRMRLEEMIEARRSLEGLEQSLVDMAEGRGIKYAITPSSV